jgi:N-acetylneuraminic acid mutarotase
MRYVNWTGTLSLIFIAILSVALIICGGCSNSSDPPPPSISNLNSSTTPSSPVGLAIEINGDNFLSAPGQVVFTQGNVAATITPSASGWSNNSIIAVVPSGNGTTAFTVPGNVTVTVKTAGGTSNGMTLALVQNVTFDVNNVTWTTTTSLPSALTGLRAVAVPASSTSAFLVVTGGFDGTKNTTTVLSNTLAADGTVGASWTSISINPLPASRAHHGMAVAHPGNSLVPVGSAFIYVIGGQANSTDSPGGTNTIFMASVNLNTGAVGSWTTLSSTLPQGLLGPAVALYNGHVYVVGGLTTNGVPSAAVYSAPVNSDGTLGSWTTSTNSYPSAVSFATAFGFGGNLYVLDGDTNSSNDPNAQGVSGIKQVNFASAHNGVVGTWTGTQQTIKARKKHITWLSFGQVIDAEGIYDGSPGSLELERSSINPDATLASFNGITSSVNQINANVYNAAAVVSPLQSASGNPRFLLLGGQAFATTPPGPLSNTVYVNNAP